MAEKFTALRNKITKEWYVTLNDRWYTSSIPMLMKPEVTIETYKKAVDLKMTTMPAKEEEFEIVRFLLIEGKEKEFFEQQELKLKPDYNMLSLNEIATLVSKSTNISIEQIKSKSRKEEIKRARQLYCYFAKRYSGCVFQTIGTFANVDHSTVTHSCNYIQTMLADTTKNRRAISYKFFAQETEAAIQAYKVKNKSIKL